MGAAAVVFGVNAGLSLLGASQESEAIKQEAQFRQQQLEFNRRIAGVRAADAIKRGGEAVGDYKIQAEKLKGSQVAALAAQGIEIDSGSAAEIRYETDKQIDTDIMRIKNNAWREAWGYKVEANNLSIESEMTGMSAKNRSQATLLSGSLSAIDYGIRAYTSKG
jgi:hypothetical protein